MANVYLCILHQCWLLVLNSYLYSVSPTVYIQSAVWSPSFSSRRRYMANYVTSCNTKFCFAHVPFCVQSSQTLSQMHRRYLNAALRRGSEGYCWHIPGSGFHASNTSVIPRPRFCSQAGLPYIHSKHEQTTHVSNTFALVSKNSSFPFNLCISEITMVLSIFLIFLYMSNTSQTDFC